MRHVDQPKKDVWTGITPSVDPGFTRKLKDYDPNLDCVFDRRFGKFVIRQPSKVSGMIPEIVVGIDVKDGYRQPDMRDIRQLSRADFAKKSAKQRVLDGEKYMQEYREKQEATITDDIRNMTKDDSIQLMRAVRKDVLKDGKANSEFRRITPKPKGKVF